jgi:hypothetical protein
MSETKGDTAKQVKRKHEEESGTMLMCRVFQRSS